MLSSSASNTIVTYVSPAFLIRTTKGRTRTGVILQILTPIIFSQGCNEHNKVNSLPCSKCIIRNDLQNHHFGGVGTQAENIL